MKKGWAENLMLNFCGDEDYMGLGFIDFLYDKGYEIVRAKDIMTDKKQIEEWNKIVRIGGGHEKES